MKKAGTIKFKENWILTLRDNVTGKILEKREFTNIIVNSWLTVIRDWMVDGTGDNPDKLAIGTGVTGEQPSDTVLETEFQRETATPSTPSSYVVKYSKDFTFTSGVSEDITEAGLFSDSTMIARLVFSAISVTSATTLSVVAEITIADA